MGAYEAGKNRFVWGMVLAWAPAIPFIIGMSRIFGGISENKAIGLGAVWAGFVGAYFIFGLVATLGFEVGAIVLLIRSPFKRRWLHSVVSFASIALSLFMLVFLGLFLWLNFAFPHG